MSERDDHLDRTVWSDEQTDEAVRRVFSPEQMPDDLIARAEAQNDAAGSGDQRRLFALAAVLALALTVFLVMPRHSNKQPLNSDQLFRTVSAHMEPEVICDTPEKFRAYAEEQFGTPLEADFDAGVALIGWRAAGGYVNRPGVGGGRLLLARGPDGEEALVIFPNTKTHEVTAPTDEGLFAHKARIAGVRVVELTRSPEPIVLPVISGPAR
ncbi:MAG: hypothetical protein AAGB51_07915 [Planctomycetota bacterium]